MTTTRPGLRYGPHAAAFTVGYVVFSYAAVPGEVMAAYDVGFTAVGLLMSAALGAFAVVQVAGGRLVDDRPTAGVLMGLVATHGALALVLDLAPSYGALLALRFLWGLAGGLTVTVGATQISRVFAGDRASRHEGFYGGALTLGGAVAFLLTPHVVGVTGWFGVHAVGGLLAVPVVMALWHDRAGSAADAATGPTLEPGTPAGDESTGRSTAGSGSPPAAESTSESASREPSDADASHGAGDGRAQGSDPSPLTNRLVLLAAGCYVATLGAYVTLSTFVTAFFDDLGVIAPLNAVALFAASLGRVGGGFAIVRPGVNDGRLIAGATAMGTAGLVGLAVADGVLLLVLPLLALAAVSLPFGAIFKTAAAATPRDGTALALVVAAGNVAALVLPAVTGWIRDVTGGYEPAFVLLAGLNVLAIAAGIAIARRG